MCELPFCFRLIADALALPVTHDYCVTVNRAQASGTSAAEPQRDQSWQDPAELSRK